MLCIVDFYRPPVVRSYKIATNKLAKGQHLKILLLSDLHSHIFGESQNKLVDLIVNEKPDMIALAGDIADDKEPIKGTELFLKGIVGLAPIYYVTGNHELRSGNIDGIKRLFKKYHVKVLEHQYEEFRVRGIRFVIGGVEDPSITKYKDLNFDWEKKMYEAFGGLKQDSAYKILLSHRPERIKTYKNTCFDLVLSGHAHGGQVRIPFLLNGLLAPNQGLFPKYAGGMYQYEKMIHIVSRGISYHFLRPRVFNPPELVVIEIVSKDNGVSISNYL
jgi:predicted MPP superfamily phosphohydrolase